MNGEELYQWVAKMPKADLHLHFEGAMRRGTLVELCAREGVEVPEVVTTHDGFGPFISLYRAATGAFREKKDIERVMDEIAEDAAVSGVSWIEVTVDPWIYEGRMGRAREVMSCLCRAAKAAEIDQGVGIGLVVAADRTRGMADGWRSAQIAIDFRDEGVVGFGLANDERAGRIVEYEPIFRLVGEHGLAAVPHCGELRGYGEVRDAINLCKAVRVGHGVSAVENELVLELAREREVVFECCISSNVSLGLFESYESHPLKQLITSRVKVVLGSDDPLLFGASLVDEYVFAMTRCGVSKSQAMEMARCSLEHSLAPEERRREMLKTFDEWAGNQ